MRRYLIITGALLALFLSGVLLAWLNSSSQQPTIIADVAGEKISQEDYQKSFDIAARGTSGSAPIPDPPQFNRCAAELQKQAKSASQGLISLDQGRRACRQAANKLKQSTLETLIYQIWIRKEARRLGITATAAEIDRQLKIIELSYSGGKGELDNYLDQVKANPQSVRAQVAQSLLEEKLINRLQVKDRLPLDQKQKRIVYRQLKSQLNLLSFDRSQLRLEGFIRDLNRQKGGPQLKEQLVKRYQSMTLCSPGYIVSLCAAAKENNRSGESI